MTPDHFEFCGPVSGGRRQCLLCPHRCILSTGQTGICGVRANNGNAVIPLTHRRLSTATADPIEKKPLFHFRPGSSTFSVACDGCNMACPFCQNHELSQRPHLPNWNPLRTQPWTAQNLVFRAQQAGCTSISFTYAEPTLSIEFAQEVFEVAGPAKLDLIFVTNGQINPNPLKGLSRIIQAANVDLKCFSKEKYRSVLRGDLATTQNTIETLYRAGVWVEVTTLLIAGFNDSPADLAAIATFIASIHRDIPWHLSAFRPAWKWDDLKATPAGLVHTAAKIGLDAGLSYVYTGNMPGDRGAHTRCPACGEVIVGRTGYRVTRIDTVTGCCRYCGGRIAGVGFP